MRKFLSALGAFMAAVAAAAAAPDAAKRCDFDLPGMLEKCRFRWLYPIPRTRFAVVDEPTAVDRRVLAVEAKHSTGLMIFRIDGVDMCKTPYMHWRWRIVRPMNIPAGTVEPDDQACVVYITDGTILSHKCLGYRWESATAVGTRRMIRYEFSLVDALCLRNRETPVGEWVEEERNVVEDFKAAFGKAPSKKAAIAVGANSQYSKSDTRVEIDYIEFRSSPSTGK